MPIDTSATPSQPKSDLAVYTYSWLSDGAGDASDYTVQEVSGLLEQVEIIPDGTAVPTDGYDVVVQSDEETDVLGGNGLNMGNASKEIRVPRINNGPDGTSVLMPVAVNGLLTVVVSNAGNAKRGKVRLYVRNG